MNIEASFCLCLREVFLRSNEVEFTDDIVVWAV